MNSMTRRESFNQIFCLSLSVIAALVFPTVSARAQQPSVLESPTIFVDPATNASSIVLRIRNTTNKRIVNVSLSAGPFISRTTQLDTGARALFSGPKDTAGKPTYDLKVVPPRSVHSVKVEVSNLVEAGESEAALYNNETEIGKLRALKYRPPFAVKLNTATPDNPELSFEQGKPSQMIIKNDDPMTYPISWELLIGEKTITGTDVILPPSSSKTVPIDTPNEWFTSGFAGLFKDEIRDGTLTLSFQPPLSSSYPLMAQKVIPFKARLRNWSPNLQYILGIPLVFVFLFLGALCSLMLRDWGPNRLQRVKIEEKLGEVEKETQWLSQRLKISSLIVPLRVERTRLLERLRSPVFFSPELPAIFEQCNDGIEILKSRLAILRDLDEAYERIWEKRRKHVPPALLSKVNDTLGQTSTMLRRIDPKEKNLDQVKMLIGSARQILDRLDKMAKKDEWLAKDLANRVKLMRQKFDEKEKIRAMETFIEIENRFPHMLPALDAKYEDKANITPNE